MSLTDQKELEFIRKNIQEHASIRKHNKILFDIFEGDLLTHVLNDLRGQLSPQSFKQIQHRVAPVNILIKLIDKLSKIYNKGPKRTFENSTGSDEELYAWYFKQSKPNVKFNCANEFFNLYKNSFIEPIVEKGKPIIRSIPSHQFMVLSTDIVNPLRVTHLVKFMGFMALPGDTKDVSTMTEIWWIYTDEEFIIVNDQLQRQDELMTILKNPNGINPFGTIPGVYVNKSKNLLIPKVDSDTLQMVKLFPVLMSDLNFGAMFQAFSIIFGIDLNEENLSYSPNAFWRFKTDKNATGDTKPQVGVLSPKIEILAVLELIKFELAFWLQSKNIRPGDVAGLTVNNFTSALSKMVDEMDTSEDRQKQVPVFEEAEESFWFKIANNFHPVWAKQKLIDMTQSFSSNVLVDVEFPEQRAMVKRVDVVKEQESEVKARFTTRRRAIQKINPGMTEKQIDELMAEIDEEDTMLITDGEGGDIGPHTHADPEQGQDTGPLVKSGEGHIHKRKDGTNTPVDQNLEGHDHGGTVGPPKGVKDVSRDRT